MLELNKILTISKFTYREIIKSRILVNTFFAGLSLIVITLIAYNLTYDVSKRVALDFGLGLLSLTSVGISLFIGVSLLFKEIESRTVYMIVSRPVSRSSFILGKMLGLIGVLVSNILILTIMTLSIYFFIGGDFQPLIIWAVLYTIIESIMVLLVVSLFSLVSSQTLSVILTLVLYVIGHGIESIHELSMVKHSNVLQAVIKAYEFLLPTFYKLNIKSYVLYENSLSVSYLVSTLGYGIFYSLVIIIISLITFERKNLD